MGRFILLLAALFALEVSILVWLGETFGPWPVVWLVLGSALFGVSLAKREGLRVVGRLQQAMSGGRIPEEGLLGAALVALAGVLLVLPGVITDLAGLCLLVPPVRRAVEGQVRKRVLVNVGPSGIGVSTAEPGQGGRPPGGGWQEAARRREARAAESDAELIDDSHSHES